MPRRRVSKALSQTQERKKQHLEICLDTEPVSAAIPAPDSTAIVSFITLCPNWISTRSISATTFLGKTAQSADLDFVDDRRFRSGAQGQSQSRRGGAALWASPWASVLSASPSKSLPPPPRFRCAMSRRIFYCFGNLGRGAAELRLHHRALPARGGDDRRRRA